MCEGMVMECGGKGEGGVWWEAKVRGVVGGEGGMKTAKERGRRYMCRAPQSMAWMRE